MKVKLTKDQKEALRNYNDALKNEDRYLGSVFVTDIGQKNYEEKTRKFYERCLCLGMDWEHGL